MIRQPPMQSVVELLRRRLDAALGQAASCAGCARRRSSPRSSAGRSTPMMSLITESSLMLASSSVFWIRCTCRVCSRTSCLRVRISERSSWISSFGHEARLDQPAGQQIGDPHRIVHVGLAAGNILDVRRVGDDQLELALAQDLPHRHPIDARSPPSPRACTGTPSSHASNASKPLRRGRERPALPRRLAPAISRTQATTVVLVHVKAGHPLVHDFHAISSTARAAGVGASHKAKSKKRAPGQ